MDILQVILVVLPLATIYFCYRHMRAQKARHAAEIILRDLASKLVPCKIEHRDNQFYLYHLMTDQFIAQGSTPREVEQNLPRDGRIFVDSALKVDIVDMVEKQYAEAKGMVQ